MINQGLGLTQVAQYSWINNGNFLDSCYSTLAHSKKYPFATQSANEIFDNKCQTVIQPLDAQYPSQGSSKLEKPIYSTISQPFPIFFK